MYLKGDVVEGASSEFQYFVPGAEEKLDAQVGQSATFNVLSRVTIFDPKGAKS